MHKLTDSLKNGILPECFELSSITVAFENPEDFRELLRENTSVNNPDAWVDTFESGFLGALALSLWFMEFDEDNWFSFNDIHKLIAEFFGARSRTSERLELRLVKGSYPPMMLDQPAIVDWRDKKVSFLFGKLND